MSTQKEMYGQTKDSVIAQFRKLKPLYGNRSYLYIMGILSDAQMMIDNKQYKAANQFINKAKLLLGNKMWVSEYLERTERIDMTIEELKNTKRQPRKHKVINVSEELYNQVHIVCNEIDCTKNKFVELAIRKLITEYEKESAEWK